MIHHPPPYVTSRDPKDLAQKQPIKSKSQVDSNSLPCRECSTECPHPILHPISHPLGGTLEPGDILYCFWQ